MTERATPDYDAGAYYADDAVSLHHGDGFLGVAGMPDRDVDVVITDPPYDARTHSMARSNSTRNSVSGKGSRVLSGGSSARFEPLTHDQQRALFAELGRVTRSWVIATVATDTAFRFEVEGPPPGLRLMRVGAWIKTNPMPMIRADRPAMGWETIVFLHRDDVKPSWHGGGRAANYVGPTVQGSGHPTAKPLPMVAQWVRMFTAPGELILDPFAGSGTTLRAAKDEGRRAIGWEIDAGHCETAARRLSQDTLFGELGLTTVFPPGSDGGVS